MFKRIRWDFYTFSGSFLSPRLALVLFISSLLIGILGFILIEQYTLIEAFYMTVITISTVGYTEVEPLSPSGQLFTSFLIITNIGIFAYSISAFTFFIVEGEIFKRVHLRFLEQKINQLQDHVIICGYGRYGKEVIEIFISHQVPFVVIDRDEEVIEAIRRSDKNILYIQEDATHDETLERAGVDRASALVAAMPDDSSNVFTVLTARQLNPTINIVSRAKDPATQRKLKLAGANHVVMPEQIGGFYMATLVNKPGTISFFSYITSQHGSDIELEEFSYKQMPNHCRGKSIHDLHIRRATGANIIAFKHPDGTYTVNPPPDTVIGPSSSFIVLGSSEQMRDLRKYLEEYEG